MCSHSYLLAMLWLTLCLVLVTCLQSAEVMNHQFGLQTRDTDDDTIPAINVTHYWPLVIPYTVHVVITIQSAISCMSQWTAVQILQVCKAHSGCWISAGCFTLSDMGQDSQMDNQTDEWITALHIAPYHTAGTQRWLYVRHKTRIILRGFKLQTDWSTTHLYRLCCPSIECPMQTQFLTSSLLHLHSHQKCQHLCSSDMLPTQTAIGTQY